MAQFYTNRWCWGGLPGIKQRALQHRTAISLTVDGGLDLVSGSSLRSQRLLQLFLIQSHFHVEMFCYMSLGRHLVRLSNYLYFYFHRLTNYKAYTTC